MSNHIHMIVRTKDGVDLSNVIRDFKRFTAKLIYQELKSDKFESRKNWMLWIIESQGERSSSNENIKVWRHENHPVALDSNKMIDQRLQYIHENPVRAGICYTPQDYVYSSASVYADESGVLEVEFI